MCDTDAEVDQMDFDFLPSPGWQLEQRAFAAIGITGASCPSPVGHVLPGFLDSQRRLAHVFDDLCRRAAGPGLDLGFASRISARVLVHHLTFGRCPDPTYVAVCVASYMGEHVADRPSWERAHSPDVFIGQALDRPEQTLMGVGHPGDVVFRDDHRSNRIFPGEPCPLSMEPEVRADRRSGRHPPRPCPRLIAGFGIGIPRGAPIGIIRAAHRFCGRHKTTLCAPQACAQDHEDE